ncbi:MAG TPA: TPM domain-containing protein [Novosphingobium sp.]|nr:TPM domain-containing protein [Novosphingobium sp.]
MLRALLALFAALLMSSAAVAKVPPRPEGPILDQADLLPPAEEAALDQKLRAYNAATGRSVLVVTVPSLDGRDIESYGVELGQTWGVGGKATDQGLILLVAPAERRLRFEVGYGLEQYLPDVLAGRIIRDTITPRFKADDYPGGIAAGIDAAIAQLDRDPAEAKAVAEAAAAAEAQRGRTDRDGATFGGVFFWVVLFLVFMSMFGRGRRGRRYGRGGGINPGIVLWGASEIARGMSRGGGGGFGGGFGGGGGGGGFGGFGGGGFGGGGASGSW